ncbi:hypothetical protein FH972_021725 [Carpinus fangiana]|uniref:ATP synthase subunit H, mitochondrial n=1 Tax=Carpinus fangiana TaxID=176857 RepID=A0A5N6KQI2_9ROSI|nr:hypothetical protein FH972_021725 [Carpinus fangiana]
MYLRELKAYKPTPVKASDAEGHVHKFAVPAAPKSPEDSDLASQIKEYESQTVEVEGQTQEAGAVQEQDWFEDLEEPVEEAAEHH